MALQIEELLDTRASKESFVDTKYTGKNPTLKGTAGDCYYDSVNSQWYYRPNKNGDNWFRVDGKNLSCNEDNGWIKCEYLGENKLFGLNRNGKAYFDEGENLWIFKPRGSKELFRIPQDSNLKFQRDKDVI